MSLFKKILATGLLVMLVACQYQIAPESTVIENVNILSMESDEILRNHTIAVNPEGYILWVGESSAARIPDDATVIDGNNRYIMPGLAEMHAHIPGANQGEEYMKAVLALYLSQGITTIRGMLGQQAHLEMRELAAAGEIDSPRIFTSGPSFSGNSVSDPEQARQRVRDQAEAGYDLLKFHPGLSLELFEAIADEANR